MPISTTGLVVEAAAGVATWGGGNRRARPGWGATDRGERGPGGGRERVGGGGGIVERWPVEGGEGEEVCGGFAEVGIHRVALSEQLQRDGAEAFDESWKSLLASVEGKM